MHLENPAVERAVALHRAGELDKAVAQYRAILRAAPKASPVWSFLAQALEAQGQDEAAIEAVRQGLRHEPGNLYMHQQLGALLAGVGRVDEGVRAWEQYVAASGGARQARLGLVGQLGAARLAERALAELEDWLGSHPDDLEAHYERGRLCDRLGRTEDARAAFERVLAAAPDQIETNALIAKLDARAGQLAEARARLERVAALPEAQARGDVHAELALVLDKLGDPAGAFRHADIAQSRNFAALEPARRDGSMHEQVIRGMLAITREQVAGWPAPAGPALPSEEAPVFIVGFPRSGTTLVEQMLSAHPRLAVSDEAPIVQRVRRQLFQQFQPRGEYPRDLGAFTPAQIEKARRWYLERAARSIPRAGGAGGGGSGAPRRIVDKQPLNTVDLAVIRLLFPESPVVYVQRDPRDTVLSVFLQGFTRGVPHLFTLEGAARLHDLFAQVFEHFQSVLGQRVHVLRYEDLAAHPEREARRLLEFLGEAWDPAVLESHAPAHRRYVTTPTYADVARPVHTGAIGRWRRYRAELAPVLGALEKRAVAWGYARE